MAQYHRIKKRPQVPRCTKDGALFVPGEDFLSQRLAAQQHKEQISPWSPLCLGLSLSFILVTLGGGVPKRKQKKGRTRRGACGIMWSSAGAPVEESYPQEETRFFFFLNKRAARVWLPDEAPTVYQRPGAQGWAWKTH